MSAALKALGQHHKKEEKPLIETTMAVWGLDVQIQGGTGYTASKGLPSPIGVLMTNAITVGVGYGGLAAVRENGDCWVWGSNNGNQLPWSIGPETGWTGYWEYRKPGLRQSITAQKELETTHTLLEIEEKERKLEFLPRSTDGRKGLVGQVIYIAGLTVTYEGKTWVALRENCATPPGSDPTAWTTEGVPQVKQFQLKNGQWYTEAFNLAAPVKSPLLKNVSAVSLVGGRGAALLKNGSIAQWGRITNYGAGGINYNASYGPSPRPLRPPIPKTKPFKGTLIKGSNWITNLGEINEQHFRLGYKTQYEQVARFGTIILTGTNWKSNLTNEELKVIPETNEVQVVSVDSEQVGEPGTKIGTLTKSLEPYETITTLYAESSKGLETGELVLIKFEGNTATFEVNGTAKSKEIPVISQVSNSAYPIGTEVFVAKSYKPERNRLIRVLLGGESCAVLGSALTGGVEYSSLTVENKSPKGKGGVEIALQKGEEIEISDEEGGLQMWKVAEKVNSGSSTIPVEKQKANKSYKKGVVISRGSGTALQNYTGKLKCKKPPYEEAFWPISEGPLKSAGWPVKPEFPEGIKCTAIALGAGGGATPTAIALTESKRVLAWGRANGGQMGSGIPLTSELIQFTPAYVKGPGYKLGEHEELLENIQAIASGEYFSLALNENHEVYIWGEIIKGLGGPVPDEKEEVKTNTPRLVPGLPTKVGERPIAIAGGANTAYALLENKKLLAWGNDQFGQCGGGEEKAAGRENSSVWKSGHSYSAKGKVYYKGGNYECILATSGTESPDKDTTHWKLESYPNKLVPQEVKGISENIIQVAAGRFHAAAVTEGGNLYTWGINDDAQIGNGLGTKGKPDNPHPTPYHVPLEGKKVLSVTCGEFNTVVILEGPEPIHTPLKIKLIPTGEVVEGEGTARVYIQWLSTTGTSGWTFAYKRARTEVEEVEIEIEKTTLEEELEPAFIAEEGLSAEEVKEKEGELEILEEQEREENAAATKITMTPTVISPGTLSYEWTPPAPVKKGENTILTRNLGYKIWIEGPAEPAWEKTYTLTYSLWESPYTYGR